MHDNDNIACFASHMGHWLIQPEVLQQSIAAIKAGIHPENPPAAFSGRDYLSAVTGQDGLKQAEKPYQVIGSGIAMLSLRGAMSKSGGKFSMSTVKLRQIIRTARRDDSVKAVFMIAETCGGHVTGTKELADDITAFASEKPFYVQVEDLLASAGVWATAGATAIYSNQMASIGSIGVVAQVVDSSGAYERQGIKVHTISTGKFKGAFSEGAEITAEQLEMLQGEVDEINVFFKTAVSEGRGIAPKQLDEIATGQCFIASKALEYGLIDGIKTPDETLQMIEESLTIGASRANVSDIYNRVSAISADHESK